MSHAVINPVSGSDGDVAFEAVAVSPTGFVSMARFGINGGDHPILRYPLRDTPLARPIAGFDVLARDQRQQRNRVGLLLAQHHAVVDEVFGRPHQLVRVINKLRHEPVPIGRVIEIAWRTSRFKVVFTHPHLTQFGDEFADPADLRGQHRDRVLAGHCVIEHRGIQRPTMLASQHVRFGDHRTHRVEDPLRPLRAAEFAAPQHQHCRVERLIGQRQTRRCFPANVRFELPDRFSIRQALQRLEHHHCRDHISRHRRTAPLRREQISEHVIRKQTSPVLSQKRVHRSLRHQMRTQRRRIQQLTIRNRRTLHPPVLSIPTRNASTHPKKLLSSLLAVLSGGLATEEVGAQQFEERLRRSITELKEAGHRPQVLFVNGGKMLRMLEIWPTPESKEREFAEVPVHVEFVEGGEYCIVADFEALARWAYYPQELERPGDRRLSEDRLVAGVEFLNEETARRIAEKRPDVMSRADEGELPLEETVRRLQQRVVVRVFEAREVAILDARAGVRLLLRDD